MRELLLALTFAFALGSSGSVMGQQYPSRPVTVIVPFAPGGPPDTVARIVAERMTKSLGQPVVIENVSGANGSIGVGRGSRATPDGYTLIMGSWNTHVANGAIYQLQYDVQTDFAPISLLTNSPLWIVARKDLPPKDLTELIAWLRLNQNKVVASTSGVGSASHFAGILFQNHTGTHFQFVPYRGAGPALNDLMAGHIDLTFVDASNSLALVRGGNIKAYAIMAKTRWAAAPDVPTVDEAGASGLYFSFWNGLWAPKDTPKSVIAKLNAAVVGALADPAARQTFTSLGQHIPPRDQQTPEALGEFQKAEIKKWWPLIKAANVKVE
jgi:tripartite-type tricarboxylate transporter receptor subunit TctC